MKNSLIIIIFLILFGCQTSKRDGSIPMWYSYPEVIFSEDKHIIFKSEATNLESATDKIFELSIEFENYIKPTKHREFIADTGIVYLLYSISKKELTQNINSRTSSITDDFNILVTSGDGSKNILEKLL